MNDFCNTLYCEVWSTFFEEEIFNDIFLIKLNVLMFYSYRYIWIHGNKFVRPENLFYSKNWLNDFWESINEFTKLSINQIEWNIFTNKTEEKKSSKYLNMNCFLLLWNSFCMCAWCALLWNHHIERDWEKRFRI